MNIRKEGEFYLNEDNSMTAHMRRDLPGPQDWIEFYTAVKKFIEHEKRMEVAKYLLEEYPVGYNLNMDFWQLLVNEIAERLSRDD